MILEADTEELRGCGLSYQKASYVKNIAQGGSRRLTTCRQDFDAMTDEDISQELIKIKGHRPVDYRNVSDIYNRPALMYFRAGDLGLRNAIKKLYGLTGSDAKYIASRNGYMKWSPYRSDGLPGALENAR
jgi:3-methyladenine DNA glycosylase/8-oxoguanine DNA glycosylase